MNAEAKLVTFKTPLTTKLQLKSHQIRSKTGCYLFLLINGQLKGFGEISPLVGYSKESFSSCCHQIKEVLPVFLDYFEDLYRNTFLFDDFVKKFKLYPSVAFGLWSALRTIKTPFDEPIIVPTSALLSGDFDTMLKKANDLKHQNIKHIKIKLSEYSPKSAILLIRNIQKILGHDKSYRLDFQMAWNYEEAREFCMAFEPHSFEYLEDPVRSRQDLVKFLNTLTFPVALDEFARKTNIQDLLKYKSLKALVIKPSLDLSFLKYLNDSKQLKRLKIILSSSYESPLGLSSLAVLAKDICSQTAHGLDTYKIYQETPNDPVFKKQKDLLLINLPILIEHANKKLFSVPSR